MTWLQTWPDYTMRTHARTHVRTPYKQKVDIKALFITSSVR